MEFIAILLEEVIMDSTEIITMEKESRKGLREVLKDFVN